MSLDFLDLPSEKSDATEEVPASLPGGFELPPRMWQQAGASGAAPLQLAHGTTTLGFVYQGGVIIAVDSRSTQGNYIASQSVKKVLEINPYLLGTMAGGAADCAYWFRVLTKEARLFELRHKTRMSCAAASKYLSNILYSYRGYGLSMGSMIAGWDTTGPALYYIDTEGQRIKGNLFAVGSGGTFAYGILDSHYRFDMSDEEAQELGRRAIYHATYRDGYSGGLINVYHIKQEGWTFIGTDDCYDLHYERYLGANSGPPIVPSLIAPTNSTLDDF
jgi:20S proteasome subunit beta 5